MNPFACHMVRIIQTSVRFGCRVGAFFLICVQRDGPSCLIHCSSTLLPSLCATLSPTICSLAGWNGFFFNKTLTPYQLQVLLLKPQCFSSSVGKQPKFCILYWILQEEDKETLLKNANVRVQYKTLLCIHLT